MDKEFHLWINSKMTILKKILKYIGVKKSKVERKNQDIDSNDSLSDMESIVLAMADDAKSLMDRWDFANFTFTKSGGFVDA